MFCKIKEIFQKNPFSLVIFITLLFCISFIVYNTRYAIVTNEDIPIFLIDNHFLYHARYPYIAFNAFMIKVLPDLLNINIQQFAFISEGITKAVLYTVMIYIIVQGYYKIQNSTEITHSFKSILFKSMLILSTYVYCFSVLNKEDFFIYSFTTLVWFNSYLFPLAFLYLFLFEIININDFKKEITSKKLFYLFLITALVCFGNEMIILFVMLFLFIIEQFIYKTDILKNKYFKIFIWLTFFSIFIGICVFFAFGSQAMYEYHKVFTGFLPNIHQAFIIFKASAKKLIIDNLLFLAIIVYYYVLNFKKKKTDKTNLYFLFAHYLFFIVLIFVPWTCFYVENNPNKMWILNPPFQVAYCMSVYTVALYLMLSIWYDKNTKEIHKRIVLSLFFAGSILSIILYLCVYPIKTDEFFLNKSSRRMIYIADKISLYNVKNNLPVNVCYNKNVYNRLGLFSSEKNVYLRYLKNVYKLDNYDEILKNSNCIDDHQYIKNYYAQGQRFSRDEIKKLDFSTLK